MGEQKTSFYFQHLMTYEDSYLCCAGSGNTVNWWWEFWTLHLASLHPFFHFFIWIDLVIVSFMSVDKLLQEMKRSTIRNRLVQKVHQNKEIKCSLQKHCFLDTFSFTISNEKKLRITFQKVIIKIFCNALIFDRCELHQITVMIYMKLLQLSKMD